MSTPARSTKLDGHITPGQSVRTSTNSAQCLYLHRFEIQRRLGFSSSRYLCPPGSEGLRRTSLALSSVAYRM